MAVTLLNLHAAAQFLQMDEKELRAMAMAGELPCVQQGLRLMFDREELDNWYTNRLLHHLPLKQLARPAQQEVPRLADFCRLETMEAALQGRTKPAVLKALAALAERSGLLYDPAEFLENLRKREEIASTAMAEGVALVHPENRDEYLCEAPFICIAKAQTPVFFGEENGGVTDLFFVIAGPDSELHLRLLAQICQLISSTPLLETLRAATTPEEMLAAVQGIP
ncbi:MAG: PTS sugar transporter subunit IIA [Victivallales bacterium]|nr:PTS sugar transporter subunit IIA [Victivallales bacterium]